MTVEFERFRQNFKQMIDNLVGRRIDYSQLYPATVVKQNASGTLELKPDSSKIRGTGLGNVAIRHGLPGVSVKVAKGARVRVGFEAEDPSKPFAALWDTDAAFIEINLGLAANAEFVALANLVDANQDAIQSIIDSHVHSGVTTGPGSSGPLVVPLGSLDSVAAEKVKAE